MTCWSLLRAGCFVHLPFLQPSQFQTSKFDHCEKVCRVWVVQVHPFMRKSCNRAKALATRSMPHCRSCFFLTCLALPCRQQAGNCASASSPACGTWRAGSGSWRARRRSQGAPCPALSAALRRHTAAAAAPRGRTATCWACPTSAPSTPCPPSRRGQPTSVSPVWLSGSLGDPLLRANLKGMMPGQKSREQATRAIGCAGCQSQQGGMPSV